VPFYFFIFLVSVLCSYVLSSCGIQDNLLQHLKKSITTIWALSPDFQKKKKYILQHTNELKKSPTSRENNTQQACMAKK